MHAVSTTAGCKSANLCAKTPEEMIFYIDVFGRNCIKEKEPNSLEELLRILEDESSISFVPKQNKIMMRKLVKTKLVLN